MSKPLTFNLPGPFRSNFAREWNRLRSEPSRRERLIQTASTQQLDGEVWRAVMDEWLDDLACQRWAQAVFSTWSSPLLTRK